MSQEKLRAFLESCQADTSLQERLKKAADIDAVVAIAKDAGFEIFADDLKVAKLELSDEELDHVVGLGIFDTWGMCSTIKEHGCFVPPTAVVCSGSQNSGPC